MVKARCIPALLLLLSCSSSTTGFLYHPSSVNSVRRDDVELSLAGGGPPSRRKTNKPQKRMTIADLQKEFEKNPQAFVAASSSSSKNKKKRTRRRVENPQQKYLYAADRRKLGMEQNQTDTNEAVIKARQLGLISANQDCGVLPGSEEPAVLDQIRVSDEKGSGAFAYILYKPAGWAVLGKTVSQKKKKLKESPEPKQKADIEQTASGQRGKAKSSLLSPESIPGWNDIALMSAEERQMAEIDDDDFDPNDDIISELDESKLLEALTPEEIAELGLDVSSQSSSGTPDDETDSAISKYQSESQNELSDTTKQNIKRIEKRLAENSDEASFAVRTRPSIVSWLKNMKAEEGVPIRGGKFWKPVAGATEVDDSGIVLLCPKASVDEIFVDRATYTAVLGNGKNMDLKSIKQEFDPETIDSELVGRVRRGRGDDPVQLIGVGVTASISTCSSIVSYIQSKFEDGIRGDPNANPLDRRAQRRLIHCSSLEVSSLAFDENTAVDDEDILPDDIAVYTRKPRETRASALFSDGSFVGRAELQKNEVTNAYREINGAADGYPGWVVDRYDKWLLVQHDPNEFRGPLPSIHDGYTSGVYYLASNPDRSQMGSNEAGRGNRPYLLEGQAAPDRVTIQENGVKYLVSLDKDLSTGIFLDQRPQRAWLTQNCDESTRVLNCFAHTGAFSIAAATAGASTVSLDLNPKWLERVKDQMEENGIEFDERHDCIYGDCFEWLEKLSKRGEKYDIVILDPPSTSVGKKKKRWSVKTDTAELVALAAPLVKNGGLLWTTTNCATLSPMKFANMCEKGLKQAGVSAKLERVQPMPTDFPFIGSAPVKNLAWRVVKK